jgi:phospholipid/cholesterol/gamma-HCH transport system substrate-binding protein
MRKPALIRLLGLVTALMLVASVFSLFGIRRKREADTYTVTAYFTKAIGLFPKSDVRVLGVTVGKVRQVFPDGPRVKVIMEIQNARKIPADATAAVIPISLISDRYIQFFPVYEGGPALRDGSVLGTDRTSIPVELDDLLASLKKFLDAVEIGTRENPGAIGSAIKNAAATLEGTGANADRALGGLGSISGAVNAEAVRLDSLLVHLNQLFQALSQRRNELARVNTGLARSISGIAEQQASLDGALTNLALITQQLGGIVRDHRPALQTDLRILRDTTTSVLKHQDSLIRSNDWLHVFADGVEQAHNGGVAHTSGGITHLDVRDAHGTAPDCPSQLDVLMILGQSLCDRIFAPSAARAKEGSQHSAPTAGQPPSGEGPSPPRLPTPLPSPPRLPLPTPIPSPPLVPRAAAAGASLPSPSGPSVLDRVEGWVLTAGEAVYGFFQRLL